MKWLGVIAAFSFIGMAVFGFVPLSDHVAGHGIANCVAALTNPPGCETVGDSLSSAYHHINSFKTFSSASLAIAAIVLAVLMFVASVLSRQLRLLVTSSLVTARTGDRLVESSRQSLRWLSLFEHSPSA